MREASGAGPERRLGWPVRLGSPWGLGLPAGGSGQGQWNLVGYSPLAGGSCRAGWVQRWAQLGRGGAKK